MTNAIPLPKEDKIAVDRFAKLMTQKRQTSQKIRDLQLEIDKARDRITEINRELKTLINVNDDNDREEVSHSFSPSSIPSRGIAQDIIKYLKTQEGPMTTEDIFLAVQSMNKNTGKSTSINSIRSYLTNLDCFLSIKKKNIKEGKTDYTKHGWVLNKAELKQN